MWAYSGHYRPVEDNVKELIIFLEEHHVDLNLVKVSGIIMILTYLIYIYDLISVD